MLFVWPVNREQSLQLLDFFLAECFAFIWLSRCTNEWSLYHARISFSMNIKMISPQEVIASAIQEWEKRPNEIEYNQLEVCASDNRMA
jgi:deoxyribodipyrimidine photolyase-related protein